MNLSNEKNTLLNTVSRYAVTDGARVLGKYVTRGAMAAAALTVATVVFVDSSPAIASCSDSNFDANADDDLAGANGGGGVEVICSDTVAGGYDADGYDNIDVRVLGDGAANPATGVAIDFGANGGKGGNTNNGSITVEDTFIGGATNPGQVISTDSDAILIQGDGNTVNNGIEDEEGPDEVGGGLIKGGDDGIDIEGTNNTVHNLNNGYGTNSGVISGGGAGSDDGIEVSGGTSGNANIINNGLDSDGDSETAYIISGGTAGGNVTGDDGVDASGWVTVNNGAAGVIRGEDRGIEFEGAAGDTLTVDNDGTIQGDIEDGILVESDGLKVDYKGKGTLAGGQEPGKFAAGIDIAPGVDNATVNVVFEGTTGVVKGTSHGIEVGNDGLDGDDNTINISGTGVVKGDGQTASDGIHVFNDGSTADANVSTGTKINISAGATVTGNDDGAYIGSGTTINVDNAVVKGDLDGNGSGDGIEGNDDNTITLKNGAKVYGDPGILVDDNNDITVIGGSEVNADPNDGINVDDDNNITIGGVSAGYVKATNGGDGIDLGSDVDGGGGSTDNNTIDIGNGGQVLVSGSGNGNGVVIGNEDEDNEDNSLTVKSGGLIQVTNADGHGVVVNGQDGDADNNTVTIEQGGTVEASGDGVRLLGDNYVNTGLKAITGGGGIFSDGDGTDNDLVNDGVIRADHNGVLVSNTNSDVDNSGGEIYAGGDGVRFTTIHTDAADGDTAFPGETESGYQSDSDSLIVAGRDGIHYDNYDEEGGNIDANHVTATGGDVNGLGTLSDPLDLLLGITGTYKEVVENNGTIEAGRHGIRVNDEFAVTNTGTIVAGGLPGEGATQGDGIHADANNDITNEEGAIIATGLDADGDSHGIQVTGESNTITNEGTIDTRGDTYIAIINNDTLEFGTGGLQDNGAGGDGIHADVNGLSLAGVMLKYDQQEIYNGGEIIAADDGIDAKSGLGLAGGEQLIDNDDEAEIHANDDGIVAEDFNIVTNDGDISADEDNEGGGDGINVRDGNKVINTGNITAGDTGNGIVVDGGIGVFGNSNEVTNSSTGVITAGLDGIRADGDLNQIENAGLITGGVNGVNLVGKLNNFESTGGTITGGTGAGIDGNNNNFITLKNTTVTVTGGEGGDGIQLGSDNVVNISQDSTVTGDDDGVEITGSDNEYNQDGGTITGRDGDGIYISGGNNTVTLTSGVNVTGEDDGLEIDGDDNNTIDITGNVSGEDDGIVIVNGSSNTIDITGNVTGDTDDEEGGDGIEINGGEGNIITVSGDVVGDPGVLLVDTEDNNIKAGSITGNEGGVVIQNGTGNTVKTTVGDIIGDADDDGFGNGVDIDASSDENTVSSANDITGEDGVVIGGDDNNVDADNNIVGKNDGVIIDGDANEVGAGNNITGGDDGVIITGESNIVTVGNNLTGTDGDGLNVSGDDNNVTVDGDINGDDVGVDLSGDDNDVEVGGDVKATDGNGVDISGDDNTVDVENEISAEGDGVVLSGDDNKVSADGIDADGNGLLITGDDNDVEVGSYINAGLNGVWIQDGSGNSVDLDGVEITAGEDGIQLDNSDNEVEHDEDTIVNAGDDGVELNYGGSEGSPEVFEWEGTINADDNGIEALGGFMSIINSGTINADFDDNNDGDGIAVDSDSRVENTGDGLITGWNGITADEDNVIINDGEIDVENNGIQADEDNEIENNGLITAGEDGINVNDSNEIENNGTIVAGDDGIDAGNNNYIENNSDLTIIADDNGIEAGVGNEIVNNGTITADADDDNDGDGINGDDLNDITNNGDISGWNGIVVDDANVIVNASGATIDAENNGIVAGDNNNADGKTAALDNVDFGLTNAGDIDAGNVGVLLTGLKNDLLNSGTIDAGETGVQATGSQNFIVNTDTGEINADTSNVGSTGILLDGAGNVVFNAGLVTGWDGVQTNGNFSIVINTGTIDAVDEGVAIVGDKSKLDNKAGGTVTGGENGVSVWGDDNTIDNAGSITGETEDGVILVFTSDKTTINNSGSITGDDDGVHGQVFSDSNVINNTGFITGQNDDGVELNGNSNTVNNENSIEGEDDGVVLGGDSNTVNNDGNITGEDEGILVTGDNNTINNGNALDTNAVIWGVEGDGIDIDGGDNTHVVNYGTVVGLWQGIDNEGGDLGGYDDETDIVDYGVKNVGGLIVGVESDGIRSNLGSNGFWTTVSNTDGGDIIGEDDGIDVGGAGFVVFNGEGSSIEGGDDGISTTAIKNVIVNEGEISGGHTGITDGGADEEGADHSTYILNESTGLISGVEAGYLYVAGSTGDDVVQIDNHGTIEVTGEGVLPDPLVDDDETEEDESAGTPDPINGAGAEPVAAIDTRAGGENLQVFIFNWGQINGVNEFSDPVVDDPETEEDETKGAIQQTNRFAILGGDSNEYIANFAGGSINGDVATQAGNDVFAMEIGSTLNGDVNLGQTITTTEVLGNIKDIDPDTEGDQAGVGFVETENVDAGTDLVVLFGEGYQDVASNISEAEVLWVNDQLTADDIYNTYAPFPNGDGALAQAVVPGFESQPVPAGTWSLNGNVSVDGTNGWTLIHVDGNGNGVIDEESSTGDETLYLVDRTIGTVVDNGRLNVGATAPVAFTAPGDLVTQDADGNVTDDEAGDGVNDFEIVEDAKVDIQYDKTKMDIMSKATLTSPVVDVWSGGTLGGHGTIITNPGANGGNGGVNLSGAVQGGGSITVGVNEDNLVTVPLPSEDRGIKFVGTAEGDLVTQDATGKVTDATKGDGTPDFKLVADGSDEGTDPDVVNLLYTVDEDDNYYPTVTLPAGFISEITPDAFDQVTDSPRYATIAPGDEINRIGTLTIVGNLTMDGRETATTKYVVAAPTDDDEEATKEVAGRTVVTNWGSQLQVDLNDSGKGDQVLVKKSGVTSAIVGEAIDTTGPGTADLVTQDDEGTITDDEAGDGVIDYEIVDAAKQNVIYPGVGKADGVPDSIAYKVATVLDGHATVDGRLDVRLDGEFVDLVNNNEPATIPDPDGPTGCGDDPDDADSCPEIPNPAYAVPDGIPDVDAKGIAKNNADYSQKALIWDIVVAEGGVSGKFDEYGFDGGPNDGAIIIRPDDPTTAEDEELRTQLLKAFILYMPDRVRLVSIPDFGNIDGLTINQQATADYIDGLTKYGIHEDSLQGLLALVGTASDIPAALDALHPEWYNAFNEVGFTVARGAEQQAYIRTIEAQGFSGGQSNRVVMNIGDDSAVGSSASDKRAAFWLAGSWANSDVDDGSDEGWLEYKYETLTGYAGFDYLINPNFLIGIMGGFGNTDVDAKNGSGNEGDVDTWQVSGYASYFTQNWFVNIGGGVGDMSIESIRHIAFGGPIASIDQIANADYDGDIVFFYGKGGYSFDLGNSGWKLTPELALSYVNVDQDAFSETTSAAVNPLANTGLTGADLLLNVDKQSVESLRGTAQVRLSKTFLAGNGGGWMPYVRVGVANEFEDDLRPITSGFQGAGANGAVFTVFGKVPRETTVIFGAGVTGKVSESFSLYLDYSGEIGGSFSEHVISGGARFHF
jgi:hypothetical protein